MKLYEFIGYLMTAYDTHFAILDHELDNIPPVS